MLFDPLHNTHPDGIDASVPDHATITPCGKEASVPDGPGGPVGPVEPPEPEGP